MNYELRAAIRSILLPVAASREAEFLREVSNRLDAIKIKDDKANWIKVELRQWKRDGKPSNRFAGLVRDILYKANRDPVTYMFDSVDGPNGKDYILAAEHLRKSFFKLHGQLEKKHLLTHDAARQILSHVGMITRLAVEERMTASEISRLIAARDKRFSFNWRIVRALLSACGCAPNLESDDAKKTFKEDTEAEPLLLGDLDILGSIEQVATVARDLGCRGDFGEWISDLLLADFHAPYLLLLHYQLLIQARFDHAVTYAYEFKPRGQTATWLTGAYTRAGIPVAKNAFLNNAKATLRFDHVWVAGRTDNLRSATALANILEAVENMGALAKDELSSQIRGLLHRYLRIKSEEHGGGLPHPVTHLTQIQAKSLLENVAAGNTNTTGILEQRMVDCLGQVERDGLGWSSKGLGDSVFAANTFRKKLGDIEFELPERPNPRSVSYESHGGNLTAPYVQDHLDTFEFVLGVRRDELETIAPLTDWRFEVVFVAHQFDAGLPTHAAPLGANVAIRYVTFREAAKKLSNPTYLTLLNQYIIDPLNSGFVHPRVRNRALVLMT